MAHSRPPPRALSFCLDSARRNQAIHDLGRYLRGARSNRLIRERAQGGLVRIDFKQGSLAILRPDRPIDDVGKNGRRTDDQHQVAGATGQEIICLAHLRWVELFIEPHHIGTQRSPAPGAFRDIAGILEDPNPLAVWTYTPEEWRRAVEDEFSWARSDGSSAQIRICETGIYLKTDSQSHLIELASGPKVVTFAGYRGTEGSPLRLRVRWKIVRHRRGGDEVKYYKEDYRIPVPLREKDAAQKVVDFFTARLQNNLDAYTAVVPDDEPISLFGKDSF